MEHSGPYGQNSEVGMYLFVNTNHPAIYLVGSWSSFQRIRRLERKTDFSVNPVPTLSVCILYIYIYIYIPSSEHRDKFTKYCGIVCCNAMRILYASTNISKKPIASVSLQEDGSSGHLRNDDRSAWLAVYSLVDPRLTQIYRLKNLTLM